MFFLARLVYIQPLLDLATQKALIAKLSKHIIAWSNVAEKLLVTLYAKSFLIKKKL